MNSLQQINYNKKKLCLVIPSLRAGGAERVLSELVNYLANNGYEISLITFESAQQEPFYPLDRRINKYSLNLGNKKETSNKFTYLLWNIKRIFALRKAFKRIQPNYIISFLDLMNIMTLIATRKLNIPVIISERTDPAFNKLPAFFSLLRKLVYPFAFKLVVQTASVASFFQNKLSKIIEIIPNKVSHPSVFKSKLFLNVEEIISIGRLDAHKDHSTLIKAFSRIVSTYPNLKLIIYGEGPERKNLEVLIENLGLKNSIILPGVVLDITEKLLNADLFIFPSKFEGFPNALCEAMSIGLPVIASNCSGNIDIVQDKINGRLFPVGSIDILESIMHEILTDQAQREFLGQNARKLASQFASEKIFEMWEKIIQK